MAEWVVETAFIGAHRARDVDPSHLVCLRIHGLIFTRGAVNGDIIELHMRATHVGRTSVTMYLEPCTPNRTNGPAPDGFLTFAPVDGGKSKPQALTVERPSAGDALVRRQQVGSLRHKDLGNN